MKSRENIYVNTRKGRDSRYNNKMSPPFICKNNRNKTGQQEFEIEKHIT